MTYEEARAFAAAGELRNRMKRDPALAIKITEKAIVERDRLNAVNAELLAALEDDWHVMAIIEPKRED